MDGRTALHYVACWGDLEVAKSILAPGTETKILFDAEGIGNHSLIELYLYTFIIIIYIFIYIIIYIYIYIYNYIYIYIYIYIIYIVIDVNH